MTASSPQSAPANVQTVDPTVGSKSLGWRALDWASVGSLRDDEPTQRQARVLLYLRSCLLIVGTFYVTAALAIGIAAPERFFAIMLDTARLVHFASALELLAAWALARRLLTHAPIIECVATTVFCWLMIVSTAHMPVGARPELISMLIVIVTLSFRAAIVPSSTGRTVVTGLLCTLPVGALGLHFYFAVRLFKGPYAGSDSQEPRHPGDNGVS